MNRFFILTCSLFCAIFFLTANFPVYSENTDRTDRNRRQPLVLDIIVRVIDEEINEVVWNETHQRVALPGSPVQIKMAGSNIVVALQFTPVIRRNGNILVAQGQIWVDSPGKGINYYTSIQTIPMELGETIYYFPLGQSKYLDSLIEIILTVNLNSDSLAETEANKVNER